MTKEQVLQKANDYCTEKGYTSETLTDDFKDKFATFFTNRFADKEIDDDAIVDALKFNLNTAFSAASRGITEKVKGFEKKESEYKSNIEELTKKLGTTDGSTKKTFELPDDVAKQLAELERFKNEARLNDKTSEIIELAKKSIRPDLHKSLEKYAADFKVTMDETSEEQAKKLTARFQDIFKDSIGDIKPLAPKQSEKRDEEFLSSIPKVKI